MALSEKGRSLKDVSPFLTEMGEKNHGAEQMESNEVSSSISRIYQPELRKDSEGGGEGRR